MGNYCSITKICIAITTEPATTERERATTEPTPTQSVTGGKVFLHYSSGN